jgi:hypothetical protein
VSTKITIIFYNYTVFLLPEKRNKLKQCSVLTLSA